jgi:hypothetical protein
MRMPTQKAIRDCLILASGGNPHPSRWPKLNPIPQPLPGFDAPGVTDSDVRDWMLTHTPHIDPDSHRGRTYARDYNVAGKIARDKANGTWP